jgi:hypothetical protein
MLMALMDHSLCALTRSCAVHVCVVCDVGLSLLDVSDIYVWGRGDMGQLGLDPEAEFDLEDVVVVRFLSRPSLALHAHHAYLAVWCSRVHDACGTKPCCTSVSYKSVAAGTGLPASQVRASGVL